jgi:prolyl-tRNA editing enzyme YbaK/EbsC (Cys-tRNA(Pro) deacylase)
MTEPRTDTGEGAAANPTLAAIRQLLTAADVPFVLKHHEPTHTSAASALARGEPLKIGAKALVMKCDDQFRLFVLPADRKLDSTAVKRLLGVKKLRFADAAELMTLTGLAPGSVPPFGPPVLPLELIADLGLLENDRVAFNAGSLTTSIVMRSADYRRVAGAQWATVSQAPLATDEV